MPSGKPTAKQCCADNLLACRLRMRYNALMNFLRRLREIASINIECAFEYNALMNFLRRLSPISFAAAILLIIGLCRKCARDGTPW